MKPNFDLIINRHNSDSIKWNYYDEDVLPLWVADMDFHSPPEVAKAIIERVDHGLFGYSKTQTNTQMAVQKWLSRRHRWDVETDAILYNSRRNSIIQCRRLSLFQSRRFCYASNAFLSSLF